MDKIWYRNPSKCRRSLAVVAGMKKTYDHAEPTKVKRWFFCKKSIKSRTKPFLNHSVYLWQL